MDTPRIRWSYSCHSVDPHNYKHLVTDGPHHAVAGLEAYLLHMLSNGEHNTSVFSRDTERKIKLLTDWASPIQKLREKNQI